MESVEFSKGIKQVVQVTLNEQVFPENLARARPQMNYCLVLKPRDFSHLRGLILCFAFELDREESLSLVSLPFHR